MSEIHPRNCSCYLCDVTSPLAAASGTVYDQSERMQQLEMCCYPGSKDKLDPRNNHFFHFNLSEVIRISFVSEVQTK
jgi:hypothetical protein